MPRGGKRPGAGRKPGSRSKAAANRDLAIAKAGVTPKEFLLNGMAFHQKRIAVELAKGKDAADAVVIEAFSAGKEFAKDVAPYCHPRLAAVEHSGPDGGPIEHRINDARHSVERKLAGLAAARGKTGVHGQS